MKVIYVSGPISGIDNYIENFNRACSRLRDKYNCCVINPVDFNETLQQSNTEPTWRNYMICSITTMMVQEPTELVVLDGWEKSKGSQAEVYTALNVLNIPVFKYCDVTASSTCRLEPLTCEFILTKEVYRINEKCYNN